MEAALSKKLLCLGLCCGPCSHCPKQRGTAVRWGWHPWVSPKRTKPSLPSFPVSPEGPAVTHGPGWPGPGFGAGGIPVRRLYKSWWWLVMRSSVAETQSDEACRAYMLSAGHSLKNGWRIKRERPGPFWALAVCRGCLYLCLLVSLVTSKMMSISLLFLQLFSRLHQTLSPLAF